MFVSVFGLDRDVERTDVVGVAFLEDGLVKREELLGVDGVVLVESLNTLESVISTSASFCGRPKIPPNILFRSAELTGA